MFDFSVLFYAWRMFLDGLLLTLLLMTIGCSLGTVLVTAFAWGSVEGPRWLRLVIQVYVEIFRNTPFIIQLFFIFFGLASINLRIMGQSLSRWVFLAQTRSGSDMTS